MKTAILEKEQLIVQAADLIQQVLEEKPDAVFCFSCSREFLLLSEELVSRAKGKKLDFSRARFVQAEELSDGEGKMAAWLKAHFYAPCGIPADRILTLTAENAEQYDEQITQWGGMDLALPSLGRKGQVCLNEPSTPYASLTHEQKLTESAKEELALVLEEKAENLGEQGITIGIRTVVSAKKNLVLAMGGEKEKAVFQTLYARDDSFVPSAFLQLPPEVTVLTDPDAARSL